MTTADIGENDLLALAVAVEQGSSHPLAQAVVREAEQRQLVIPPASGTARAVLDPALRRRLKDVRC